MFFTPSSDLGFVTEFTDWLLFHDFNNCPFIASPLFRQGFVVCGLHSGLTGLDQWLKRSVKQRFLNLLGNNSAGHSSILNSIWREAACYEGKAGLALPLLTDHAHLLSEFEVLGRFGIAVAADLSSSSGTNHISRNVPWDQGRKDVYLVCDLFSRLAKPVGTLSLQQGGSGGSSPQVRRLAFRLCIDVGHLSLCCLQCPALFLDTNPQCEQVVGWSGPLLFEAACVIESETGAVCSYGVCKGQMCLKKSAWEQEGSIS